jgi:7,8-dihydropterin-6-yl-methyl-4-(beta-D-ribofuranosyl)aminobenzene 5'-phosphate synthase
LLPLESQILRDAGSVVGIVEPARVTILFDAFGKPSNLKRGWGHSVLVEYGGRRVLFDTGGKSAEFAFNVSSLAVDLKKLDFVVLSHRHNDCFQARKSLRK